MWAFYSQHFKNDYYSLDGMKRILIIVPELSIGGGAERVAGQLGYQLEKKGHKVFFLTFYKSSNTYKHSGEEICLNEPKSGSRFSFLRVLPRARAIASLVKEKGIDTCVSFLEISNFSLLLSKRFGNKARIVLSVHNNPEIYLKKSRLYSWLMRHSYNKADLTVCVSQGIAQSLETFFKTKNTTTIYNMVDMQSSKSSKVAFPSSRPNIVMIGRLVEQKAYEHLLNTLSSMESPPNIYVLGDGPDKSRLEKLKEELGLTEKIHFLGQKSNVNDYLRAADGFLLYSRWEGFGIVIIEALAQNTPVISTDSKFGPREILTEICDYKQKLKYPYKGKWGILISPFDGRTGFHKKSAKELSKALEDINSYKTVSNRVSDFLENKIIENWEKVI